jgi:hypothetical protein
MELTTRLRPLKIFNFIGPAKEARGHCCEFIAFFGKIHAANFVTSSRAERAHKTLQVWTGFVARAAADGDASPPRSATAS